MAVKILVSLGFPPIIWSRRSAPSPGLFPAPQALDARQNAPRPSRVRVPPDRLVRLRYPPVKREVRS